VLATSIWLGRRDALAMPDPKSHDVGFHEETTDPLVADVRNFYKVEKWTRDGTKVDSLLCAGNNLGGPAQCSRVRSNIGLASG
jgi:hypothetical protein